MNKNLELTLMSIAWVVIGIAFGYMSQQPSIKHYKEMLSAYDQYNKGAEQLLDDIDDKYNWVDGFDNYDYYEGRARIDSLMQGE